MKTKLTPAFVMNAKVDDDPAFVERLKDNPNADRTTFWDEKMPSFGLMATAKGAKSYVVQYRADRRSRCMTIDGVLDLSKARKRAKALLGEVAHGRDPLAEKREAEEAASNTLKSIAEDYLKREGKNLRNVEKRKSIFKRNVFPRFPKLGAGCASRPGGIAGARSLCLQ